MRKLLVCPLIFCLAAIASAQSIVKGGKAAIEAGAAATADVTVKTVTAQALSKTALPAAKMLYNSGPGVIQPELLPAAKGRLANTALDDHNAEMSYNSGPGVIRPELISNTINRKPEQYELGKELDRQNKLGYEVPPQIVKDPQTGVYSLIINGKARPVDVLTTIRRAELLKKSLRDEGLGFEPKLTEKLSAEHAAGFDYLERNFYLALFGIKERQGQLSRLQNAPVPLSPAGSIIGLNLHYSAEMSRLQSELNESAAELALHTAKLLKFLDTTRHHAASTSFGIVLWDYTAALGSSPLRRNFWD